MSDVSGATAPNGADGPLTMSQAVAALGERRRKENESQAAPEGETPTVEAPQQDSPQDGDAGPDDSRPTSEAEAIDPPSEAPIDRPSTWSKDRTETWNKLDRATQEYLLEHDREYSRTI